MQTTSSEPDPEFVMLCSTTQDWRTQAEVVAERGRPMLLIGSCDSDLHFLEQLAATYQLAEKVDRSRNHYLLWRV